MILKHIWALIISVKQGPVYDDWELSKTLADLENELNQEQEEEYPACSVFCKAKMKL